MAAMQEFGCAVKVVITMMFNLIKDRYYPTSWVSQNPPADTSLPHRLKNQIWERKGLIKLEFSIIAVFTEEARPSFGASFNHIAERDSDSPSPVY